MNRKQIDKLLNFLIGDPDKNEMQSFFNEIGFKGSIEDDGTEATKYIWSEIKKSGQYEYILSILKDENTEEAKKEFIAAVIAYAGTAEEKKDIVDNYKEYNLELKDIVNLIISLNDTKTARTILEEENSNETSTFQVVKLLTMLNDSELTKKYIKNYKDIKFGTHDIEQLVNTISDDVDFIKEMINEYPEVFNNEMINKINNDEITKQYNDVDEKNLEKVKADEIQTQEDKMKNNPEETEEVITQEVFKEITEEDTNNEDTKTNEHISEVIYGNNWYIEYGRKNAKVFISPNATNVEKKELKTILKGQIKTGKHAKKEEKEEPKENKGTISLESIKRAVSYVTIEDKLEAEKIINEILLEIENERE